VLSGGVLCVIGVGLLALALPQFRRYDDRSLPQEAAHERVAVAAEADV
jgi:hypothetical protein